MRVNVEDLLADRHAVRTFAFSERIAAPAEEVTLPEPVEGEFVLRSTGRTVYLAGRVRTVAGLVCGACLTAFRQPLEVTVGDEFCRPLPPGDAGVRGEQELGPDEFLVPVEPGDVIDVTEVVRQHLVLALPIAPRCSPGCRGLCPRCGADRNTVACHCDEREIDPRLEPLRRWAAGSGGRALRGEKRRSHKA